MKIAKKHRGDFGYIRHIKSYNIRIALGLLVGCLAIYLVGFLFFDDLAPFFTIVSVLMILPTAQFMSKYFSFLRYASVTKEQFEAIESMCDNFLVLGELPVIRGKKNYMLLMTVISSAGIHILTDGKMIWIPKRSRIDHPTEGISRTGIRLQRLRHLRDETAN